MEDKGDRQEQEANRWKRFARRVRPKIRRVKDDVLFGEVWSREDKLSLRDRSLVTVVALQTLRSVFTSKKPRGTVSPKKKLQRF